MEKSIYFDIRQNIEFENLERLNSTDKKYKTKFKLLRKLFSTGDIKAYYINGLLVKRKLYEAVLIIHAKKEFIGETEGGLKIHSPATVQIFILKKIKEAAVTPEGLTKAERDFIITERKKPKRKRGEITGDFKKTINWIADQLHISNRKVADFCRRKKI